MWCQLDVTPLANIVWNRDAFGGPVMGTLSTTLLNPIVIMRQDLMILWGKNAKALLHC
jgi:hypothetical protein